MVGKYAPDAVIGELGGGGEEKDEEEDDDAGVAGDLQLRKPSTRRRRIAG